MKQLTKRRIGGVFWIVAIGASIYGWNRNQVDDAEISQGGESFTEAENPTWVSYFTHPVDEFSIQDPVGRLQKYDPIFLDTGGGDVHQVGHVLSLEKSDGKNIVHYAWYGDVPANECQLFQHHASGSLEEVVQILLPPEKRLKIKQRLAVAMSSHGEDLSRAFVPLIRDSLKRSMPVIEEELRKSVAAHRDEIDELAAEWKDEIISGRLIPLARREILPIVREHGQPPAEAIGREIWDRASLWRFGWRAVYDKTPLPQKNLVQEEWKRFVKDEAVPIIEAHMDDIVVAIQRTISDIASNKTVRRELIDVAEELGSDPQAQALVRSILKETLIENERLRNVWGEVWTSDEARAAMDMAGDRLEPIVRKIGDDVFGSQEEGIDPNFARVLRTQILGKDRRWIMALHAGYQDDSLEQSKKQMPYPLVYIAKD